MALRSRIAPLHKAVYSASHGLASPSYARSVINGHEGLVSQLALETQLEAHNGCVNCLAWNGYARCAVRIAGSSPSRIDTCKPMIVPVTIPVRCRDGAALSCWVPET